MGLELIALSERLMGAKTPALKEETMGRRLDHLYSLSGSFRRVH